MTNIVSLSLFSQEWIRFDSNFGTIIIVVVVVAPLIIFFFPFPSHPQQCLDYPFVIRSPTGFESICGERRDRAVILSVIASVVVLLLLAAAAAAAIILPLLL